MLNYDLVLKRGELYTVGAIESDGSRELASGLYFRDTRHLSAFDITIDGIAPELLSVTKHDSSHATVLATNRVIHRPEGALPPQQLLISQDVRLDGNLMVTLSVHNFGLEPISAMLEIQFAADFRDLFDIRGFHRDQRGKWVPPKAHARGIELGYVGLDGRRAATSIEFDRISSIGPHSRVTDAWDGSFLYLMNTDHAQMTHQLLHVPAASAQFGISLAPHEDWSVNIVIAPLPATDLVVPEVQYGSAARVVTDNLLFNQVLDQCRLDLDALQTPFPDGIMPAAGIPWFVAPFGRDSLITGLQTLHLSPDRAEGTLRTLAALQGTQVDSFREEEPGKILHEMRYGEMARTGEVPHSPYFGSIDATPLWLWLLAETVIWTGKQSLVTELLPDIRAAIAWIQTYGDLDGDGLVEYQGNGSGTGHIKHQVWKDSHDSLNHANGTPVVGPIAAVEVQGYVYAAFSRLAIALGEDDQLRIDLSEQATRLRQEIEDKFWLEEEGTYAQALDGNKQPVRAVSSNGGHLLVCAVPSVERSPRMATRMMAADMHSGWGVRTLSSEAGTYNPMSYHNGSVWPHDNSLIGRGFYRYGQYAAGHAVSSALFDAAQTMSLHRLPELYCGFPRSGIAQDRPVGYPVSCSPQAWASGAIPYLVAGMLGLEVLPERGVLRVDPNLPDWLNEVTINHVRVLGHEGRLHVMRTESGYSVESTGLPVLAEV